MDATAASRPTTTQHDTGSPTVLAGLIGFAAVEVGLTIFMAAAPHAFYTAIGPFGARNDHFVRDLASYNAALAVGLVIAIRHASWRVPMLAIVTVQFALHSINHLIDISNADPSWVGYFDFFALAGATVQLAGLTWLAVGRVHTSQTSP
ncbi:MAG: hypothetical protein JWN81_1412 [Solirubrobacterales bacterium]|jgi:hypothetical protein|nr:hypothetical protein [Solirubrobacterales bacterium]